MVNIVQYLVFPALIVVIQIVTIQIVFPVLGTGLIERRLVVGIEVFLHFVQQMCTQSIFLGSLCRHD